MLAFKKDKLAFLKLIHCFIPLQSGFMYTPSEGLQKVVSVDYNISKKFDINAQIALSNKQFGIGLNKEVLKDIKIGAGIATKYTKLDPEIFATVTKEWKF